MPTRQRPVLVLMSLCAAAAWGQVNLRQPQVGYLYPAGAQQGTTVQITVGGQFLNGATDVYVSGEGVRASVVRYIRPLRNLQKEQRDLLQERLKEVRQARFAELDGTGRTRTSPIRKAPTAKGADKPQQTEDDAKTPEVKLPDHPLLIDLDDKSLRELAHVANVLFFPRTKLQINRQISEMVLVEVTVDADAPPGSRRLRLGTRTGVTNPVVFQVGSLPETRELEPNNRQAYPELLNLPKGVTVPKDKPLELPVLLNGQIMPGDVDRFRFRARRGQRLVMQAHARSLIPYLADAVPGWFQATLALYDAQGKEVAFADDYRFDPDPVLFYQIPEDGEYELEIRDSIYRGREDFVYRVSVSEQPFVTETFPLGGRSGIPTTAWIAGWNLPKTELPLDTEPGADPYRTAVYQKGKWLSNPVSYRVDTLPECVEVESNNTVAEAQAIELPAIVNGRIGEPGDVDVFKFEGHRGESVVAEVYGRRLDSPIDSLLRLTDASGKVLQWNDDHMLKEEHLHTNIMGLLTHHADSYLMAELPQDGTYYVHLADSQRHGSDGHGYRVRISPPQVDFALRVTPSGLYVQAGGIAVLSAHALRKDGFNGPIDLVLKDTPPGFELHGARIPADCNDIRLTLTAPAKAPNRPVALQIEGRATVNGQTIRRLAVPADDVMQAFLYRHLVPAEDLLVAVQKVKWRAPALEVVGDAPVHVPAGGSTEVTVKAPRGVPLKEIVLALHEPPEGVTLRDTTVVPGGLSFQIKADKDALPDGFAGNLIVEAFREYFPKQKDGTLAKEKRRYSQGFLPAIPVRIAGP